jgi:1-deoxyxylulose-5-phosphate synthase
MQYTRLRTSGLKVSRISLGCMSFGVASDRMPWSQNVMPSSTAWRKIGSAPTSRGNANPTVDQHGRPLFLDSDEAIVDAVQRIAEARGVSMAQVAMAWVLKNPVVTAPIVGATKPHHLADAVAALDVRLTDDEITALEAPYTPREPTYF